jgi:hypothetical protein
MANKVNESDNLILMQVFNARVGSVQTKKNIGTYGRNIQNILIG